jgi:hypothetical protein
MVAAERGGAPNTIAAYTRDLADLSAALKQRSTSIVSVSSEDLRRYLGSLSQRGFAPGSIGRRLSAMRQLFRFLNLEGLRTDDPCGAIEGPKRQRPLPKVLSIAEVDHLLAEARRHMAKPEQSAAGRLRAARLTCLLELLYATGMRVSELVELPRSAAAPNPLMLRVRGTAGSAQRDGKNCNAGLSGPVLRSRTTQFKVAFPFLRQRRAYHAPAFRARVEERRSKCRIADEPSEPACASPCFRQPSPPQWGRSAGGPDVARSCGHFDYTNLHARAGRAAQERGAGSPPARRGNVSGGGLRFT